MDKANESPASRYPKLIKRRWLQFSLRTLLLLIAVITVWLGLVYLPAKRADLATKDLERLGVEVYYDYQLVPGTVNHSYSHLVPKPGPAFLRNILGDVFFQHADWLMLGHKPLKADDLKLIEQIPTLRMIYFDGCGIGDENMACFSNLRQLDYLLLRDNHITDQGLKSIKNLTHLETLDLTHDGIHDDGLVCLEHLTNLKSLWLSGTKITDEGLKHLVHLKKLKEINVSHTAVTPEGAEKLQIELPNCNIMPFTPQDEAAVRAEQQAKWQAIQDDQKRISTFLQKQSGGGAGGK